VVPTYPVVLVVTVVPTYPVVLVVTVVPAYPVVPASPAVRVRGFRSRRGGRI